MHQILRRFVAVVVSSAFWKSLRNDGFSTWPSLRGKNCAHNNRQTTTIASQQPQNNNSCRILQRPRHAATAKCLAHHNRTIAIASDFRVDGAKSPEIPQKEGISASEIATRNRKSIATFHRTLRSQCKVSKIASDFWGPRWASQSHIAKIAAISVR